MARLIIYEELEETETIYEMFDLSVNRILIGSDEDNHLILVSPDIDPMHASLELRDDCWVLQDLGGPGGTMVNGDLIEGPFPLKHKDLIQLGHIKMRFDDGSSIPDEREDEENPGHVEVQPRPVRVENPSGRVWFAKVAISTVAVILVIVAVLAIGYYLELIPLADLLPAGLLGGQ